MTKPIELGSASDAWMDHYITGKNACEICFVADTAAETRLCPEGRRLRADALAAMKGGRGTQERAGRVWPA